MKQLFNSVIYGFHTLYLWAVIKVWGGTFIINKFTCLKYEPKYKTNPLTFAGLKTGTIVKFKGFVHYSGMRFILLLDKSGVTHTILYHGHYMNHLTLSSEWIW